MKKFLLFAVAFGQAISSFTQVQFEEITDIPFDGVRDGSVVFADMNGDGSQDLIMTGTNVSNDRIAKLYFNDGNGVFTEETDTPFDGIRDGSIAYSDEDADGNYYLLITGLNNSNDEIAKLYVNDGSGDFTEVADTPFDGVRWGSVAFADVNGNGYQDVLITGSFSGDAIAKLYLHEGGGVFTEDIDASFEGVRNGEIAFGDLTGNGALDLIITGRDASNAGVTLMYTNDGAGEFTEAVGTPFEGLRWSSVAIADVDGDGSQDVLIAGSDASNDRLTILYTNDGVGNFTEMTGTIFEGIASGSVAIADVDGDGSQDILVVGSGESDVVAKLYLNDGAGVFTEVEDTPFEPVHSNSVNFADVYGDGKMDVMITGENPTPERTSSLYRNITVVGVESFNRLELNVFPNPTDGAFRIEVPKGLINQSIRLFNAIGQVVGTIHLNSNVVEYDLSNYPSGLYFIQIQSEDINLTRKLIKN